MSLKLVKEFKTEDSIQIIKAVGALADAIYKHSGEKLHAIKVSKRLKFLMLKDSEDPPTEGLDLDLHYLSVGTNTGLIDVKVDDEA